MGVTPAVRLIGAPVDLADGAGGARLGPEALRRAGLAARLERLGYRVEDAGDIESPNPEDTAGPGDPKARYLAELVPVLEDLAAAVRRARDEGRIPLVLGGNHSVGLGALSGMTGAGDSGRGDGGRTASLGLIWVDAHPDANTPETTVTGNLSGMPWRLSSGGDGAPTPASAVSSPGSTASPGEHGPRRSPERRRRRG